MPQTPEPWQLQQHGPGWYINGPNGEHVGQLTASPKDAKRMVDCVNACEDVNPGAIPELLESLRMMLTFESLIAEQRPSATYTIERAKAALAKAIQTTC